MIDSGNLRAASLYINNQLLSRGLLRDGQTIDFADPEGSDGGLQDTMGRIISIVNDLILRRDRDAEHRESLSSTLRTLRADAQRQTTELSRQTDKLTDAQRRLDGAEATERALRTQLKTAEQGIHKLKEDLAKMKSLVAQTRSACANEVRKRDRQIDSLKKAIADAARVRGGGKSRDVITITVTGDYGDESAGLPAGATESDGYNLRMETNAFLTELARGLSEENEGLLALVRRTVEGLREMSGLDRDTDGGGQEQELDNQQGFVTRPPEKSAEELAAELEAIVEHLRSILTNPSFAPIEEVEVRDEAIHRLRAGLETMESRWKDAVHMIDGWRRRMVSSGRSVDMEDLQMGLRLSPVRVRDVEETVHAIPMRLPCVQEEDEEEEEEVQAQKQGDRREEQTQTHVRSSPRSVESVRLVSAAEYEDEEGDLGEEEEDDDTGSDSSIFQDDNIDIDDLDVEEPNVQILQLSTAESVVDFHHHALPEPAQKIALKDSYSSGNKGRNNNNKRPNGGDFTTIVEENTWDLAATGTADDHNNKSSSSNQQKKESRQPTSTSSYDSPLFGKSIERPAQTQTKRNLFSRPLPQESEPASSRTQQSKSTSSSSSSSSSTSSFSSLSKEVVEEGKAQTTTTTTTTTDEPPKTSPSSPTTTKQRPAPAPAPRSPRTRLPRPNPTSPTLSMATIAAKLAASEREADAARVRAKLKAVRRSRRLSGQEPEPEPEPGQQENTHTNNTNNTEKKNVDPVKRDIPLPLPEQQQQQQQQRLDPSPKIKSSSSKRKGGAGSGGGSGGKSKVASRRRSTLSPWELQGLISGNVVGGVRESPAR
ncbi:Afadin and alpha-actinin-binding-domain-containing protein [Poronia punctata]|nr:Afadin and alpha-actinin-binding-domain-containing protein [Poronia punctata]